MGHPEAIPSQGRRAHRPTLGRIFAGVLLILVVPVLYAWPSAVSSEVKGCEQAAILLPSINASELVHGQKDKIITWLSDAVKVPTEVYDDMGDIDSDPRWNVFYDFAAYLEKAFPLVHEHLRRTRVATHALVFEWKGTDESLKPTLITAHSDVVPVLNDTRSQWDHDPFGGEYDGKSIWGRGAMDDKSGLIGSMAAVELLLQSGQFQPRRTVILAFGNDEESSGIAAGHINEWLLAKYGRDSIAILIDEGDGMSEVYGEMFALPAVAEKGYLDAEIKVITPGGHSSVPPRHTGIGLMALLLAELERHPYEPQLGAHSPLVDFVACAARYAPSTPSSLKKDVGRVVSTRDGKVDTKALERVKNWWTSDESVKGGIEPRGAGRALISTTQAIDIINGGVKINALPEVVTAVVDHRVSIESTVDTVQQRMVRTLLPVVKEYKLDFTAWGKTVHEVKESVGKVTLDVAFNGTIETAPVSPFSVETPAWRVLAGTIKGVWSTRLDATGDEIYVAPRMSTGNTDTKNYWSLTKNIYRFVYLVWEGRLNNAHTVNEFISADAFVEQVRFFVNIIVNVDEAEDM